MTRAAPKQIWVTEEEETLPLVEYQKFAEDYLLFCIDPRAIKALRLPFVYLPDEKRYELRVDELPKHTDGVELRKFSTRLPTEAEQAKFADVYKRYVVKKGVMDKMAAEVEKDEAALVKMLDSFGLRLKPGSRDRRLLTGETLVHHMEAILPSVDEHELRKLAKKYPELKKVFKEIIVEKIDRVALAEALAVLPGSVAAKIMVHDSVMSFNERPVKKPKQYLENMLARVRAFATRKI